jgi:hypothetical protein
VVAVRVIRLQAEDMQDLADVQQHMLAEWAGDLNAAIELGHLTVEQAVAVCKQLLRILRKAGK